MKKLMIAAAIVCAAAFAQAATYNWSAESVYVIQGSEGEEDPSLWAGNALYFFDANVYDQASFIASLDSGTDGFAKALNAKAPGFVGEMGPFSFGVDKDGTLTDKEGYASAYVVMLDSDSLATAKNAYIINYEDVEIKAAHGSGSQVLFSDNEGIVTGEVGGAGWYTVNTPEPTSGLLLLIGVAGLALRRRRA